MKRAAAYDSTERMVDARRAHEALRIPLQWLNNRVQRRARSVPHYRIGHVVRFRLSELEQWRDLHAEVIAPMTAPDSDGVDGD